MRKFGLISLALVLALGALGVGYAMWTDTVDIEGEIITGSVDVEIVGLSSTYVYKDLDDSSIHFLPFYPTPAHWNKILVASANTTIPDEVNAPLDVRIEFNNLFPTTTDNITGDIVIHYIGTVPAHVVLTNIEYEDEVGADLAEYLEVEYLLWDDELDEWIDLGEEIPQLHYCDILKINVCFVLPQDNSLMNASGTISGSIMVHQWNEKPI
jgi:hypothetical protein